MRPASVLEGPGAQRCRASAAPFGVRALLSDAAGSVAAEFTVAIPAVVVVLACCVGGIQAASQQVRLTDAAADAARSLARGDPIDVATSRAQAVAGEASLSTSQSGDFVCVTLTAMAGFPAAASLGLTVQSSGCALAGGL